MISEWPEGGVLVVDQSDGEWHSRWPGDLWLKVEETERGGPKEEEYGAWRMDVGMILASFSGKPAYGGWFEEGDKTTHAYAANDIAHKIRASTIGPWDRDAISGVYTLFDLDPHWLITHVMSHMRAAWHAQAGTIRALEQLVQERRQITWPETVRPVAQEA